MTPVITERINNKALWLHRCPLDLFGRLEAKPATVLSGLLTVSNKYFFGTQVKFFVS